MNKDTNGWHSTDALSTDLRRTELRIADDDDGTGKDIWTGTATTKRMVADIENLHDRLKDAHKTVAKLQADKSAMQGTISRWIGVVKEHDIEITALKKQVKELTARCSTDHVLHTRKLPEIKIARHGHKEG